MSLSASASTNFTTGSFAHSLLDSWLPSDRTAFTMFVPAYLRRLILSTQKEGFTMKEGSERTWAIYWEHVSSWLMSSYNYTLPFKGLGSVSLCKFLKLVSYAHQVCFVLLFFYQKTIIVIYSGHLRCICSVYQSIYLYIYNMYYNKLLVFFKAVLQFCSVFNYWSSQTVYTLKP